MLTYKNLREKYSDIIYQEYKIIENDNEIKVIYTYILGEFTFAPSISISKEHITNNKINKEYLEYLFFNYGLVNIINYYKLSCPKNIIVNAAFIDKEQIQFFKKLIYNGLSEYFYRNNIDLTFDEFTNFTVTSNKKFAFDFIDNFDGNLILVGGGKDSIVSLEILKDEQDKNSCLLFERNIYPKNMPSYNSIYMAGYQDKDILIFNAEIDSLLLKLNKEGFLNGHVPFSSQLAFAAYIMAYLNKKKYIIVSNEASSNEGNIKDKNINHQYSKSYEFENDFRWYTNKYFNDNIEYFSLLRPLLEIQIAKIFSKHKKYFNVFRSCNLSSKNNNNLWCGKCPKCLFLYIILSPYIDKDELINIFGNNLLDDIELLDDFKDLIGKSIHKPFECVGTFEEVKYACNKTITIFNNNNYPLPKLLEYYQNNVNEQVDELEKYFNQNHNVPSKYIDKIKKELI